MTSFGVIRRLIAMIGRPAFGVRRDASCAIGIELANVALGVSAPVLLKLAVDELTEGTALFGLVVLFVSGFVIAWTGTNATTALKHTFTIPSASRSSLMVFCGARRRSPRKRSSASLLSARSSRRAMWR